METACWYKDKSPAQRAYNRFCYDFITVYPGVIGRLPALLEDTADDSCLFTVVRALAYANYHGRYGSDEAYEASRLHYGQALQQLVMVMTVPDEMQRDDSLMVIFLFGLYEMFTSSIRDGSWITHMKGTQTVIAERAISSTSLMEDSHYLSVLCSHLVVYYLTEQKTPPPDLDRWIQQIPFENEAKKHLILLMSEAAGICAKLSANTNNIFEGLEDQTDLEIFHECLELDLRLDKFCTDTTPDWNNVVQAPISHSNRPSWSIDFLSGPGAPDRMYSYSNRLAASKWNMCRSTRIRLNLALLEFLQKRPFIQPQFETAALRARMVDLLLSLTTEISYTIPNALAMSFDGSSDFESVDKIPTLWAYMVTWPAYTSFQCLNHRLVKGENTMNKAIWFRKVLTFLRETIGIAKAKIMIEESEAQGL
ncbi:uncharacterized protein N7469_009895 [Penicillium citrinum]|uniref:Uncharacterized protein n=1 Tax=Penicillium citrinum TaxID=5077 RepID=A0A9W9NJN6_PENCI|nr:uncharacterized protein N7469_009895 [Penicillium citrinum]KAJ5221008.1 hypothetical protein N7469_009895 [Penicillium citrinum]